jgi:hypothetical protein
VATLFVLVVVEVLATSRAPMGRVKLTDKKGGGRGSRSRKQSKKQSKKQLMWELTARSVLERELQGVSDAVNEKGGWTTMVCSATPTHSGDTSRAIYGTDAELLPSTGMPGLHALIALFDFRLSAAREGQSVLHVIDQTSTRSTDNLQAGNAMGAASAALRA